MRVFAILGNLGMEQILLGVRMDLDSAVAAVNAYEGRDFYTLDVIECDTDAMLSVEPVVYPEGDMVYERSLAD